MHSVEMDSGCLPWSSTSAPHILPPCWLCLSLVNVFDLTAMWQGSLVADIEVKAVVTHGYSLTCRDMSDHPCSVSCSDCVLILKCRGFDFRCLPWTLAAVPHILYLLWPCCQVPRVRDGWECFGDLQFTWWYPAPLEGVVLVHHNSLAIFAMFLILSATCDFMSCKWQPNGTCLIGVWVVCSRNVIKTCGFP